jgi:hypothetical protein
MALKFKLNSKEEVPAGLAEHYVERDGAFVLDVEGVVDRARMEEVRAHNANLIREREGLTARLSAVQMDQGVRRQRRRAICGQRQSRISQAGHERFSNWWRCACGPGGGREECADGEGPSGDSLAGGVGGSAGE